MIRSATENDLTVIADLWEQMCLESRPESRPEKKLWLAMTRQMMTVEAIGFTLLVAEEDKQIIGFVSGMVYREPSTGMITAVGQHFYVLPGKRNGYTPATLYKEIISCALLKCAEVIEFSCLPEKMRFWQKHGFHIDKVAMRRYVRE